MDKLNLTFSAGQVMKAESMNIMARKVEELVTEANKLPAMNAAISENRVLIGELEGIDISQADFEALQEAGELDPKKTYYIYEE